MVIYIPIEKYKYKVSVERDLILHEYYIIRRYKSMIYIVQKLKDAHKLQKRIPQAGQERTRRE